MMFECAKKYGLCQIAAWTLMIVLILAGTLYQHHQETIYDALQDARKYNKLNRYYRLWNANLGGLYARMENVRPNPFLTISDRDISTIDHGKLTLVNPAYMTRMVFDMVKTDSDMPIISKLTSLNAMNPANKPDKWEREALAAFRQPADKERFQVVSINGSPYLRLISRFDTEKSCLKCHDKQGDRIGDVQGGISISVPLASYYLRETRIRNSISAGYLLLWLSGGAGLALTSRKRHQQEENLRASEEKFRTVCDWTQDWEYWVAPDNAMLYSSPSCQRLTGYPPEAFYEDPGLIEKIIHPDDRQAWNEQIRTGMSPATTIASEKELRIITREGGVCWTSHVCRPVYAGDGTYRGERASIRDITVRKRAEEAIREQDEELSTIFENAPLIMLFLNGERRVYRMNGLASAFIGSPISDVLGKCSGEALGCLHAVESPEGCGFGPHCQQCAMSATIMDSFETGRNHHQVEVNLPFSIAGKEQLITLNLSTTRVNVRNLPMVLLSLQDITEHRKLEAQLRQAQKMESIGTLAGGIAHDFNNILSVIIGYGQIALQELPRDDLQRQNIGQMLEAADRAAHLTRDLLLFSRKQVSLKKPIDLNDVVRSIDKFMVRVIGEDIICTLALDPGALMIFGDQHHLEQVLMNLAVNSRDAMPTGGALTISSERFMLDDGFAVTHGYGRPGMYALITVTDTGTGFDEKTRLHIFDPFFTTKGVGKGTGLGLAVVYGIIKQHDGYINVYSEPGKGTTFRIYLPLIAAEADDLDIRVEEERPERGSGTILLAEDDESLREMSLAILRNFGYEVIAAVDGKDAIEKFRLNRDTIQLLLFDLIMPKMTGKEAYDTIRELAPDIRAIFVSGYGTEMLEQKGLIDGTTTLVNKPFSPAELLNKIRTMLDEGVH